MLNQNISIHETEKIIKISENINMKIENNNGFQTIFLNEEDVTEKIRSKEVTELVSQVSSIVEVRLNMVKLQRKLAEGKDVIMEGRDITTYVFPNANVKIYLDNFYISLFTKGFINVIIQMCYILYNYNLCNF